MTTKEKNRLDLLEERTEKVETKLEEVQTDIKKILFYMHNDDSTNQKGIVERLQVLQTKVSELVKREEIYKAKATVWGMIGSGILGAGYFIIKYLLTKLSIIT